MKAIITALAFATALGTSATPASAQGYGDDSGYEVVRDHRWGGGGYRHDDILSERRIVRIVHREGFVEIDDVRLRRDRYIVRATRPNGAVFRLALDAYDGSLIARERVGWSRGYDRRGPDWPRGGIEFRFNLGG